MTLDDGNGWKEYRRLILKELENIHTELDLLSSSVTALQVQMAVAQSRQQWSTGIISMVISLIVTAVLTALIQLVLK